MAKLKLAFCLFVAALVVASPLPWSTPAVEAMANAPVLHRVAPEHDHLLNSHLHGVKPIRPGVLVKKGERRARYWVGRWAYGYWVGLHRGYGAITGNVQSAGKAVTGVKVMLISARGPAVKATHITHTNISGGYIMMRVRAGSYRVRAVMGERAGQSPIHLYSGTIVSVPIKI